jgi:hypothetical protein
MTLTTAPEFDLMKQIQGWLKGMDYAASECML